MNRRPYLLASTLSGVVASGMLFYGSAATAQPPVVTKGVTVGAPPLKVVSAPSPAGSIWVGMTVAEPTAAIRDQLGLPAKQGLVVNRVTDAGPADKAGLRLRDVILAIDGESLGTLEEIVALVGSASETTLTLHVIRDGEPIIVKLTPERRGGVPTMPRERVTPREPLPNLPPAMPSANTLPPGTIVLPKGMSLSLRATANDVTKIAIKQGEKSWEVTPSEMGTLPTEVRGITQAFLNGLVTSLGEAPQVRVEIAPNKVTITREPTLADPKQVEPKTEKKVEPKQVEAAKLEAAKLEAAKLAQTKLAAEQAKAAADRAKLEADRAKLDAARVEAERAAMLAATKAAEAAKTAANKMAATKTSGDNSGLERIADSIDKLRGEVERLNSRVRDLERRDVKESKSKK